MDHLRRSPSSADRARGAQLSPERAGPSALDAAEDAPRLLAARGGIAYFDWVPKRDFETDNLAKVAGGEGRASDSSASPIDSASMAGMGDTTVRVRWRPEKLGPLAWADGAGVASSSISSGTADLSVRSGPSNGSTELARPVAPRRVGDVEPFAL